MRLRNIPGSQEVIDRSGFAVLEPEKKKGTWRRVFAGEEAPLYIEVGMGKGRFLMDMAQAHPENRYIGIEMYSSVLVRAIQKASARVSGRPEEEVESLPIRSVGSLSEEEAKRLNFRFLRVDARVLPDIFNKGEVDGIYLNFSDPWPKERHADRRLTSVRFLRRYEQILKPEGRLEFKTDNKDLFQFSLDQIREAGWHLEAETWDLHRNEELSAGNIMTEYEERFSSRGQTICKLIARLP